MVRASLDDLRDARRRLRGPNDPDAVHDFRVALRRLRSTLRAYRSWFGPPASGHKLRKHLKRLARSSGHARDPEVGLRWLNQKRKNFPVRDQPAFDRLVAEFETRRVGAHAQFREKLDKEFEVVRGRIEAAMRHVDARVPALPLATAAGRLIQQQVVVLSTELSHIVSVADTRTIHSARIEAKRLRYLLEPLAPELGNGRALLQKLKRFQDEAGELCDRQVLSAELIGLAARYQAERTVRGLQSAAGDAPPAARASAMPVLRRIVEQLGEERERLYRSMARRYLGRHVDEFLAPYRRLAERLADRRQPRSSRSVRRPS